jgi:subtilase family serine protease
VASGEKVEGYLDIKLSVSESRYTNWPPACSSSSPPLARWIPASRLSP